MGSWPIRSSRRASKYWWLSGWRPWVETIRPSATKRSATETAWSSRAAGIVAQVDDEAAQPLAQLALGQEDLLAQGPGGGLVEAGKADHRDVVDAAVADGLRHDVVALDVDRKGAPGGRRAAR